MSSIFSYVSRNFFDKITRPKNIKAGLITALAVTVMSQLIVFYLIVAARVNPADSYIEAFKALFSCRDCGLIALWEMLITAFGLLFLHLKLFVLLLSFLLLFIGILLVKMLPDRMFDVEEFLALFLFTAIPAGIIGLALFEILPYIIGNYN